MEVGRGGGSLWRCLGLTPTPPPPCVQPCCRPLCYEQSERRLHKSLQMKMEEMSLSGLDNSKLEVSPPPPRVPPLLSLRVSTSVAKSGICAKGGIWVVSLVLRGNNNQLKGPRIWEEEGTQKSRSGKWQRKQHAWSGPGDLVGESYSVKAGCSPCDHGRWCSLPGPRPSLRRYMLTWSRILVWDSALKYTGLLSVATSSWMIRILTA